MELLLPGQRMGCDLIEIVVLRRPVEETADATAVGDHGHDVAGAARGQLHSELAPGDTPDSLDRLQHGIAAAISAVQRHRGSAGAQIGQGCAMRLDEIADMDEITDAASVRRRIVGTEDIYLAPLAG